MLQPVVFQVPYPPYNAGETAGVPVAVAEELLASGRAVRLGERLRTKVPPPLQGSVPQPVRCGACQETFIPDPVEPHRCKSLPVQGTGIFDAGFNYRGRRRERFRRGR